jgi:hypothetical protein
MFPILRPWSSQKAGTTCTDNKQTFESGSPRDAAGSMNPRIRDRVKAHRDSRRAHEGGIQSVSQRVITQTFLGDRADLLGLGLGRLEQAAFLGQQ